MQKKKRRPTSKAPSGQPGSPRVCTPMGVQLHRWSRPYTGSIATNYQNQQSINATVTVVVWIRGTSTETIAPPSTDTEEYQAMTIKIGGFVLEVGVWMLYVRVPAAGELCWTPQLGATIHR